MPALRRVATSALAARDLSRIRQLLVDAFAGDFSASDWASSVGGTHVVMEQDGLLLAHASVVARTLRVAGRPVGAGYVEAVATHPAHRRRGHASAIMAEVAKVIEDGHQLGALSTGLPALYERLGWERWAGPTFVSNPDGLRRTADDDGGVLVLRTPTTGALDLAAAIACDWREGDVW